MHFEYDNDYLELAADCPLTPEQRNALDLLSTVRYEVIEGIDDLIAGGDKGSDIIWNLVEANMALESAGLEIIHIIPTDHSTVMDMDTMEVVKERDYDMESEQDMERFRADTDGLYAQLYDIWQRLYDELGEYLREIDWNYNTNYAADLSIVYN